MIRPWRRLALAAALYATAGVGVAAAQTIHVMNAPPKGAIELVVNLGTVASGTADANGDAKLTFNVQNTLKKQEADVNLYLDICGDTRRILMAERGVLPTAAAPGCDRHEIQGLFVVRSVTNMVVDVGSARPGVWLKQGPVPKDWLVKGAENEPAAARTWRRAPVGLVVFGGGALPSFSNWGTQACGDVTDCKKDTMRRAYTVGVDFWVTRWLAAEGSYLKTWPLTAAGSGNSFRFDSSFDPNIFVLAGKVGAQLGPVRIFGKLGGNYHDGVTKTTETTDPITLTVDGVEQTIPGGTQTWEVKTRGWGLIFGGGLEAWVKTRFALYAEAGRAWVQGHPEGGGEVSFDDRMLYASFGARVHLGKKRK